MLIIIGESLYQRVFTSLTGVFVQKVINRENCNWSGKGSLKEGCCSARRAI